MALMEKDKRKNEKNFLLVEATIIAHGPYSPEYTDEVITPFLQRAYRTIYNSQEELESQDKVSDGELLELMNFI